MKKQFIKIKVNNNWYNLTYLYKKQEVKFPKSIYVRWPNKIVSKEKVLECNEYGSYNDMGHTYEYSTVAYYIETKHNGVKVKIPIEKVELNLNELTLESF